MPSSATIHEETDHPRTLNDVPGWLTRTDRLLFKWLLTTQTEQGVAGDLLELGVFQGRTAIHMGRYLAAGERFTVCDLFDLARAEESIRPGARKAYKDLTQATFERNYLAFHDTLPTIVRGRTDTIVDHVAAGSCRFVHIDASHMYEHVRGDLQSTRKLSRPDGLVVFDDYRTEHTPGTAAAVWEAVATDGLRIVCVTANKFYGTWGNPTRLQDDLIGWTAQRADHRIDVQSVLGQRLLRVVHIPRQAAGDAADTVQPGGDAQVLMAQSEQVLATARTMVRRAQAWQGAGRPSRQARSGWRRAAVAVLPPIVTQAVRSRRRGKAG